MSAPSDAYKQTVRELSDRLVEAQRPIRILDAIKWDSEIEQAFFAAGCRELPPVDRGYYQRRPLPFDADEKRRELEELELDIRRQLGEFNPIGVIMRRMCREYADVVEMLQHRGTPTFSRKARELYGSAYDAFYAGQPTLADLGTMMSAALDNIDRNTVLHEEQKTIKAENAVELLQERLESVFAEPERRLRVKLSDGIISDASAGYDYIKLRQEALFNERDLRLIEIHEGWVHLGTTLNGMCQPICTFLSKGPPSSTITQEGLALLMEILALASYPPRVKRVTNRIHAVAMVEDGANFLDVFRFFREQGHDEQDSYQNAIRVFRGSTPEGGPFTKDISYSKGFVLIYNYLALAVRKGLLDRIPFLFCGKATLEDIRTLKLAADEGLVVPPKYLPPHFADLNALTAWMCYSNFLGALDHFRIEADYTNIL